MNLHEFQAKELLAQFGLPIPRGRIGGSAGEAEAVARRLGFDRCVVKAQVHAGGRAANGGVRLAASPTQAGRIAAELIGRPLVTNQTGPAGQQVRWVYIEEAVEFSRSLYSAVVVDRSAGEVLLITGDHGDAGVMPRPGGAASPAACVKLRLSGDRVTGDFDGAASTYGLEPDVAALLAKRLAQLADAAVALDATMIEVSPLVLTQAGELVVLDAKVTVDDNALFRQSDLAALREASGFEDGDPVELAADRHQINYLKLNGDIGVVVNGAGLALATLDLLHEAGGRPANFMDIRTTATSLDIAYAFELIAANPRVRAVLVNVHGGGMQRCDTIADGIGIAVHRSGCAAPVVVRLAGNNAEFGAARLKSYGVPVIEAADMWEAAKRAAQLATRKAA
ncbi:MAG: ADP-forming succinate--CoA ligase subunit beta [Hyphomicrobiaceae bacterium]|nr:ADP-forming succinate--CoA ligase subunit beta [Hyphomicrobiaceae bacterium]